MPVIHQPKGGMCRTCRHVRRDCSALPFDQMPDGDTSGSKAAELFGTPVQLTGSNSGEIQ